MRVLLGDVPGFVGHRLEQALGRQHDVVVLDGDPRDLDTATRGTSAVDAVVCPLPELGPRHLDPLPALDRASRGIYNLIKTAAAGGTLVLGIVRRGEPGHGRRKGS
jgi:nucleoside-diphosphate-sugar epimerase